MKFNVGDRVYQDANDCLIGTVVGYNNTYPMVLWDDRSYFLAYYEMCLVLCKNGPYSDFCEKIKERLG